MSNTDKFIAIIREGVENDAPAEWFGNVLPSLEKVIEREKEDQWGRGFVAGLRSGMSL